MHQATSLTDLSLLLFRNVKKDPVAFDATTDDNTFIFFNCVRTPSTRLGQISPSGRLTEARTNASVFGKKKQKTLNSWGERVAWRERRVAPGYGQTTSDGARCDGASFRILLSQFLLDGKTKKNFILPHWSPCRLEMRPPPPHVSLPLWDLLPFKYNKE